MPECRNESLSTYGIPSAKCLPAKFGACPSSSAEIASDETRSNSGPRGLPRFVAVECHSQPSVPTHESTQKRVKREKQAACAVLCTHSPLLSCARPRATMTSASASLLPSASRRGIASSAAVPTPAVPPVVLRRWAQVVAQVAQRPGQTRRPRCLRAMCRARS